MIAAAGILLALATLGFAIRLVVGPSLADRIIAVDGMLAVGCGAIAVEALHSGDGEYLPTIVVVTLIGFVSTSVAARFIEGQDEQDCAVNRVDDATGGDPTP